MNYEKQINLLGFEAKDLVTKQKGVITHVGFDLYGCVQCVMSFKDAKKEEVTAWYDVQRLTIIGKKPVMTHHFKSETTARINDGEKGGFDKPLK